MLERSAYADLGRFRPGRSRAIRLSLIPLMLSAGTIFSPVQAGRPPAGARPVEARVDLEDAACFVEYPDLLLPQSPSGIADFGGSHPTSARTLQGGDEKERLVLRFHILHRADGSGGMTDLALLDDMMRDLNYGFRDTPWVFVAEPDIVDIDDDTYYELASGSVALALFTEYQAPGVLSIFFSDHRIFGATQARSYASVAQPRGLVFADVVGWPYDSPYPPHELGHLLWLYHPYETQFGVECVSGSNCATAGDRVCDTPASPAVYNGNTTATGIYYGALPGPCPGDPIYDPRTDLYMEAGWSPGHAGYLYRSAFSDGQIARMQNTLSTLSADLLGPARPDVFLDCDGDFIDDIDAIQAGSAIDLNRDYVPDACQSFPHAGDLIVCGMTNDLSNRPRYFDALTGEYRGALWSGAWWMHRMRLGPQDGFVYVTSLTVVQRLSLETGRLVDNFIDGVLEGAQTFVDFLFEPSGDLLVLDNVTANIRRYRGSDGTYQGQFANVGATGMTSPKAMEYGPDGRIYVVGSGALGNTIQVFRATDGAPEGSFIQPGSGGLTRGQGMLFHADGSLYVSNGGDNSVLRYSATTGSFLGAFVDPGSGGLQNPHGLAFGPDGHLYVASRSTHSVKRYDGSSGAYLGDAISPGAGGSPGSGGLIAPAGLLFVPAAPAEVADDGPDAAPLRVSTSPNPFPAGVVFTMDLGRAETVTIDIIDVRGRRVRRIASRLLGPGRQSLHWDGARDDGKVAGAGVYYYRAHAGQSEASGTIVRSR